MALRLPIVSGALAALVLAGCGAGSHKTPASPPLRELSDRVLGAGELSGFRPDGGRVASNATTWVDADHITAKQMAEEEARLVRLEFVDGLIERLVPVSGSGEGLSIVEHFQSAGEAQTELGLQIGVVRMSGQVAAFAVPAIPGARGFALHGPRTSTLAVLFADGAYYYSLGASWSTAGPSPVTRASVIAAAQHLYNRVSA
jgi:hypothetical protein